MLTTNCSNANCSNANWDIVPSPRRCMSRSAEIKKKPIRTWTETPTPSTWKRCSATKKVVLLTHGRRMCPDKELNIQLKYWFYPGFTLSLCFQPISESETVCSRVCLWWVVNYKQYNIINILLNIKCYRMYNRIWKSLYEYVQICLLLSVCLKCIVVDAIGILRTK